jgi:hypothetical protein
VQHPKTRQPQSHHLAWLLPLMALLTVLCLAGCGGGGEEDAVGTPPGGPGVDPRVLIQAEGTPAPGGPALPVDTTASR